MSLLHLPSCILYLYFVTNCSQTISCLFVEHKDLRINSSVTFRSTADI